MTTTTAPGKATTAVRRRTTTAVPKKEAEPVEQVDDKVPAGAEEVAPVTRVDRSLEKRVDHVSAEEATGKGKAARLAVPRSLHSSWARPTRAAQPGRHHRRAGHQPGADPGPYPPRAHDGLSVHLLSGGGGHHGR